MEINADPALVAASFDFTQPIAQRWVGLKAQAGDRVALLVRCASEAIVQRDSTVGAQPLALGRM